MKKPYDRPMTVSEIAAVAESGIDFSDIPERDESFWRNARLIESGRTQSAAPRVKQSVPEAFMALGNGDRTRLNAVLETQARILTKEPGPSRRSQDTREGELTGGELAARAAPPLRPVSHRPM